MEVRMNPSTPEQTQQPAEISPTSEVPQQKAFLVSTKLINWSSVLFAILQSVCSAFVALSGVRLLIGIGAFAAASSALRIADRMHISAIRIPMMLLALIGSVWNLVALWRVRSLRRRPSSAWRQQPVSAKKRRSERIQFSLSVLTLLLLAAELVAHYILLRQG
jgi:hypothetical protein